MSAGHSKPVCFQTLVKGRPSIYFTSGLFKEVLSRAEVPHKADLSTLKPQIIRCLLSLHLVGSFEDLSPQFESLRSRVNLTKLHAGTQFHTVRHFLQALLYDWWTCERKSCVSGVRNDWCMNRITIKWWVNCPDLGSCDWISEFPHSAGLIPGNHFTGPTERALHCRRMLLLSCCTATRLAEWSN